MRKAKIPAIKADALYQCSSLVPDTQQTMHSVTLTNNVNE